MELRAGSAARFAGAGALILFLCWQHVQATRLGYQVETARKDANLRRGRVETLRVDLEARLSPEQVAARAARIGLIPASPDALRRLSESEPFAPHGLMAFLRTRGLAPFTRS